MRINCYEWESQVKTSEGLKRKKRRNNDMRILFQKICFSGVKIRREKRMLQEILKKEKNVRGTQKRENM